MKCCSRKGLECARAYIRLTSPALVSTLWLVGVAAYAQVNLTEQAVIDRVLARPEIEAFLSRAMEISQADVIGARLWPNPSFEFNVEDVDRTAGDTREEQLWLRQEFEISGSRRLRVDAAEARAQAGRADYHWRRRALIADARTRFYVLLAQQSRLDTTRNWLSRLENAAAVIEARAAAGEASGYDRLRLDREFYRARVALRIEETNLESAWQRLAVLLGVDANGTAANARGAIAMGSLLPEAPEPREDILGNLTARPDLQMLAREAEALESELRAAERAWVPKLELGVGNIDVDDRDGNDTGMLLSARFGLPFSNRGQADQARSRAEANSTRAELVLATEQARSDIATAHARTAGLIETAIELADADREAGNLVGIAEAAYRGGELSLLELLDVYETTYEHRLLILDLEHEARDAQIELDRLRPEEIL